MSAVTRFVVVAHVSRIEAARGLSEALNAHIIIDHDGKGANANHRKALEWASEQGCRVVVLEDDAELMPGFAEKVESWLARFPEHLCSFYLGTGRPPQYQLPIATKLIEADKSRADYITLPRLIHGVCYSLPESKVQQVLNSWDARKAADYAIGDAYAGTVVYPCYSLVEHADSEPVERHPDRTKRTERRKAWRLSVG